MGPFFRYKAWTLGNSKKRAARVGEPSLKLTVFKHLKIDGWKTSGKAYYVLCWSNPIWKICSSILDHLLKVGLKNTKCFKPSPRYPLAVTTFESMIFRTSCLVGYGLSSLAGERFTPDTRRTRPEDGSSNHHFWGGQQLLVSTKVSIETWRNWIGGAFFCSKSWQIPNPELRAPGWGIFLV